MLKRITTLFLPSAAQISRTSHAAHDDTYLHQVMRQHFLKTYQCDTQQEKQRLLHEAIRADDYDLARKFLDQSNIFSKDEYGDTPIDMALNDHQWAFLRDAARYVTQKNPDSSRILHIIGEEANADTQSEMLGHARAFFVIEE